VRICYLFKFTLLKFKGFWNPNQDINVKPGTGLVILLEYPEEAKEVPEGKSNPTSSNFKRCHCSVSYRYI
jgi:hypothetical protein